MVPINRPIEKINGVNLGGIGVVWPLSFDSRDAISTRCLPTSKIYNMCLVGLRKEYEYSWICWPWLISSLTPSRVLVSWLVTAMAPLRTCWPISRPSTASVLDQTSRYRQLSERPWTIFWRLRKKGRAWTNADTMGCPNETAFHGSGASGI